MRKVSPATFTCYAAAIVALITLWVTAGCHSSEGVASDTDSPGGDSDGTDSAPFENWLVDLPPCERSSDEESIAAAIIKTAVTDMDECLCSPFKNLKADDLGAPVRPYSSGLTNYCGSHFIDHQEPYERDDAYRKVAGAIENSGATCLPYRVEFQGKSYDEIMELNAVFADSCAFSPEWRPEDSTRYAVINENGVARIADTQLEDEAVTQEEFNCANEVLAELTFPCLASSELYFIYFVDD